MDAFAAGRFAPYAAAVACLLASVLSGRAAYADEDVVAIASDSNPSGRVLVSGQIVDYTGNELRIMAASGIERRYPPDQVLEIRGSWLPEQEQADALRRKGEYQAAALRYQEALRKDERRWVRRKIVADMVECFRESDQVQQAGEYFLLLIRDDPQTPYFSVIPLRWLPGEVAADVEAKARSWLAREDLPAARLLGASYLLAGAHAADARRQLELLTRASDRRIGDLAEAQSWRERLTTADVVQLETWAAQLERFPAALRAGPYFALGRALAYAKQPERAALDLMRIPILYPDQRRLSAEALWLSCESLLELGRKTEAIRLMTELARDYGLAPQADLARRRLDELAPGGQLPATDTRSDTN